MVYTYESMFQHTIHKTTHTNKTCKNSDSQIVAWWEDRQEIYPKLSQIALRYLNVPSSSMEVERSFSTV